MNSSPQSATPHGRAVLMLLFGAAVIGVAPILVRLTDAGPAAVGVWRLVFALPLLALMTARAGDGPGRPTRLMLLAGVVFAFDMAFWHYGIAYTSVAKATVLTNLTPVVVTAVTWIAFGQRPTNLFLLAVALAVTGASVMAMARPAGAVGPNQALGDALSTATALWYALYFLAISAARRTDGATRIMFWSSATGAPLLLLAALLLGERIFPATRGGWLAGAGLGVIHIAGQGSIAWALGRLPAATAAVTVLVQPVVAAILGWLLFDELFAGWQLAGGAIALGGVVLAQTASRPGSR